MMIFNESRYKNTFCADSSDSDSRYTVRKTYLLKSKAKKLQNRILLYCCKTINTIYCYQISKTDTIYCVFDKKGLVKCLMQTTIFKLRHS